MLRLMPRKAWGSFTKGEISRAGSFALNDCLFLATAYIWCKDIYFYRNTSKNVLLSLLD